MKWADVLVNLLAQAPTIITGVDALLKTAPAATKAQTAMVALVLASGAATSADPADQPMIALASETAASIIALIAQSHAKAAALAPKVQ